MSQGKIVQIIGAVVDVEFAREDVPKTYDALKTGTAQGAYLRVPLTVATAKADKVAGQALLKTGTLEGVRALAGYVINNEGRRFVVVALFKSGMQDYDATLTEIEDWLRRRFLANHPTSL